MLAYLKFVYVYARFWYSIDFAGVLLQATICSVAYINRFHMASVVRNVEFYGFYSGVYVL